jgi:hypothetical protein
MKRPYARNALAALAAALTLALLLAGGLTPLAALEWGGTLNNTTTPTYSGFAQDWSFQQEDKLALWLEAELNPRLSLTIQGSYTWSLDRPYLFDVDILRLQGRYPLKDSSVVDFSVGRFRAEDFSALLFSDNLDGAQVAWRLARANLSLTVGYLGLELQPVSTVSMSKLDYYKDEILAPPRLLEILHVELPELIGRQSLVVAAVAQQDLRAEDQLLEEGSYPAAVANKGGRLSTEYLGLALRGPLASALYYELFGYLGTGRMLSYSAIDAAYIYEWMLGGLLGAGLKYYREQWLSSRAELRVLLATGDEDYIDSFIEGNTEGLATTFTTISQPELALLFSPRLGNLVLAEASYSLKPAEFLQTLLRASFFLRPTLGRISDGRVDPAPTSSSRYLGFELDASARLRLFSDLGLVFTAGVFLPGSAFPAGSRQADFGMRAELSFSF